MDLPWMLCEERGVATMSRRSTGTIHFHNEQWWSRFTRADGTRTKWLPLDPAIREDDRTGAEACAADMARDIKAAGEGLAAGETVEDYAKRWCNWREGKGLGCVPGDRVLLARHILPALERLDVREVTRDDLKRLVTTLDRKASTGKSADGKPFAWKTAVNAWGVARSLFRDAQRAKDVSLCVREDNPAEGVAGPDVGPKKAKTYLWPSEFMSLVSSERVPVRWARLFALAVYSYARAGELDALRCEDLDLEHATLHVHRATDRVRKRGVKATKSETARRIPIEPALLPLLQALHHEVGGKGRVFRMPSVGVLSHKLKFYLRRAGVERPDLFASDATRKAITFHDLRATGVTWMAARGDDPLRIMQRAGHEDFETTKIYLREAENLSKAFGAVFPALPDRLLGIVTQSSVTIDGSGSSQKQGQSSGADGNRTSSEGAHDRAVNEPIRVHGPSIESSSLLATGDRSRPLATSLASLSDEEIASRIEDAELRALRAESERRQQARDCARLRLVKA
jgi:integrase